jgi:hypothetical protein
VTGHEHDVRHEARDIEPRAVTRFGLVLVFVTIASLLVLIPFFRVLESFGDARQGGPAPLAFDLDREPPAPRLQEQPRLDVTALREEEEAVLGSFAWVDQDAGVVRVPIEHAIDLIAERGVPERGQPSSPDSEAIP